MQSLGYEGGCCEKVRFARPPMKSWLRLFREVVRAAGKASSGTNRNFSNRTFTMDNNNSFDSSANTDMIEIHECADVIVRLGDYVDNDLLRAERLAVEAHLNDCPECAAFLASYNHVVESAAELREPEQPIAVDVQNRLRKALNQRLGLNLSYIA